VVSLCRSASSSPSSRLTPTSPSSEKTTSLSTSGKGSGSSKLEKPEIFSIVTPL